MRLVAFRKRLFLDKWCEEEIRRDLEKCFAHYEKGDIVSALVATEELFSRLAGQTAEMKGYRYPKEAEDYARSLLNGYF